MSELRSDAQDFASGRDMDTAGGAGPLKTPPTAAPPPATEPVVKPSAAALNVPSECAAIPPVGAKQRADDDEDDIGWDDEDWGDLGASTAPAATSSSATAGTTESLPVAQALGVGAAQELQEVPSVVPADMMPGNAVVAVVDAHVPDLLPGFSSEVSDRSREFPPVHLACGEEGDAIQDRPDRLVLIERDLLEAREKIKRLNDAAKEQARATQAKLFTSEQELARCMETMGGMQVQIAELSTALLQVRSEIKELVHSQPVAAETAVASSRISD